ncbi:MAG: glycine betaine ABC transporter substrate-binding protein, partial [Alphaproteobacteria bacterium]
MRRLALIGMGLVLLGANGARAEGLTIGSKSFTESVILGEIMAGLARDAGIAARHRAQLGGTRILWSALKGGEIDAYPEYTGTIAREILAANPPRDAAAMRRALSTHGIAMSRPIGFNNTYALAMKPAIADRLGVKSISDLARHPRLRLGFSNEFMDRGDGWPALRRRYALPQTRVRGIDHDLAYRGLAAGDIDAIDIYTTDAEIAYYGLRLLTDDRGHFPAYDAVLLYRADLAKRLPGAVKALRRIEGRIDASRMIALNVQVKLDGKSERTAAAGFLEATLRIAPDARDSGLWTRLADRTAE